MIFVDGREGSKQLVKPLRECGLDVEETTLNSADIYFEGRGEKGAPVAIGIEYKHLSELVGSLRTNRLQGHQLLKMQEDGYDFKYLFVEGELLYNRRGQLLRRAGRRDFKPVAGHMTVGELLKRVYVLHLRGGLNPWWTQNQRATVKSIEALYHTWTDTDLDKHGSHIAIYTPPRIVPISDFREMICRLDGVGVRTSLAIERHVDGSLGRLLQVTAEELSELTTADEDGKERRIGLANAAKIVASLRELR